MVSLFTVPIEIIEIKVKSRQSRFLFCPPNELKINRNETNATTIRLELN